MPPIRYDLRLQPSRDHRFSLPAHHRLPTKYDLRRFATCPPLPQLRLWHRRLPWYFDIIAKHHHGVTIADLLIQLHSGLSHRINPYDYWTTALSNKDRERIDQACMDRISALGSSTEQAICRIDFLHDAYIFTGLYPSADGSFELGTMQFI